MSTLSETRWLSRTDKIANYTLLVEIPEKNGDKLIGQSRSDAISFTYSIMTFSIIISFVIIQYLLGYTRLVPFIGRIEIVGVFNYYLC